MGFEIITFSDMGLNELILQGLQNYGLDFPSPIQRKAIIPIILGNNSVTQA